MRTEFDTYCNVATIVALQKKMEAQRVIHPSSSIDNLILLKLAEVGEELATVMASETAVDSPLRMSLLSSMYSKTRAHLRAHEITTRGREYYYSKQAENAAKTVKYLALLNTQLNDLDTQLNSEAASDPMYAQFEGQPKLPAGYPGTTLD
jgi:hypothetical protein